MKTKLFSRICGWIMAAMLTCGSLASCGLDADNMYREGWEENGNTITYTCQVNLIVYKVGYIMTFTFTGDTCTGATMTVEYPKASYAEEAWNDLDDEEKAKGSRNGKKITLDVTEDYVGMSKDELKSNIEQGGWAL